MLPLDQSYPYAQRVHTFLYAIKLTSVCCQVCETRPTSSFIVVYPNAGDFFFFFSSMLRFTFPLRPPTLLACPTPTPSLLLQSFGYCGAQYAPDVALLYAVNITSNGTKIKVPVEVMHTRLRSQHTALRIQKDFIKAMSDTQHIVDSLAHTLPQVRVLCVWCWVSSAKCHCRVCRCCF